MRILKRVLIGTLILAVVLGVAAWVTLTYLLVRPTQYEPTASVSDVSLRPWEKHDVIYQATEFPYIRSFEQGSGKLLYVGVHHTSDAKDPQLTKMEELWKEFRPTVALCEGRERLYRYMSRPTTGQLSESQLVRILAQGSGVPLYTLEPTYEAEVAGLLKKFEPRLVATFLTLRVFTSEAKGNGSDLDSLALDFLRKRVDAPGLEGSLTSIEDLDAYWKERFPDAGDWRKLPDTESVPQLKEVGDVSREIRGEHMIRTLVELTSRGQRVFAVVGASHVIRQEPALKKDIEDLANGKVGGD